MAAGLGFKTFTTGEVLTAADVNGYLMQGILVFANAAARTSAVTSPQEGQYSFLKDTNALEYYDGAAWVGAPVGDITSVTAGTGISGGGSSGAVTITNDMATTITAAGDLVVGTGNATYDNLPIGTTGQVLTADTTVSPYKVKWAAPSAGTTVKLYTAIPGSDFTTSSTTFVDATGYTITFTPTTATNKIQFTFDGAIACSGDVGLRLLLDGSSIGVTNFIANDEGKTIIRYTTDLSAASHTIKLQVRSNGGVSSSIYGTSSGYFSSLSVLEVNS